MFNANTGTLTPERCTELREAAMKRVGEDNAAALTDCTTIGMELDRFHIQGDARDNVRRFYCDQSKQMDRADALRLTLRMIATLNQSEVKA